ncbi:MAG: heparin lyase I family protein [Bacteroidota bacterium]
MAYFNLICLLLSFWACDRAPIPDIEIFEVPIARDSSQVRTWRWEEIELPEYTWPGGTAFGNGLFVDVAFDPEGVAIEGNLIRFKLSPESPLPPANGGSSHNYRSEIHTMPWEIRHPLGTEQWIGWRYYFGDNYEVDTSSPITIFQNHPGVRGLSPQIELEIAAYNDPAPAKGGEIQIINEANGDRIVTPVLPLRQQTLDVVVHVIYGDDSNGLLQVWLNGELHYSKAAPTVYKAQAWGGNNKWGIYHHTFNNDPDAVQSSLDLGAGNMELWMGPLRMLTRSPKDEEYRYSAYHFVKPN